MKKFKKNILLIFIFLILLILSVKIYAAKGSFSVSKTSISIGEGEKISFKINTKDCEGKFEIKSSDTSVAKVSTSSVWAPDENTITVTAGEAGNAIITIRAVDVSDTDENPIEGSCTIKVAVKSKSTNTNDNNNNNSSTTKSSNANLKTLGVTPKQYDFSGFNKNKTKYSVTVPANVDSLKVVAKTEDSKASLKITGNSGFDVGSNNNIKIVVTAEDKKTTKTYEINVTKLAEEEEKPGNVIEEDEDLYLTSLEIEGIELTPEFSKDVYSYSANLNDENLTSVKVKAKANIDKANIETTGNTNLVEGENTINVVVTNGDKKVTYQIILTKALTTTTTIGENQNSSSSNNLIGSIKNYAIIAIVIVVLIIVAIIVLICLIHKENKKLNQQQDNEEYNVYDENDKDEFKKAGSPYKDAQIDKNIKEALEEINKDNEEKYDVTGQNVEYESKQEEQPKERKRGKGKH